MGQLLRDLFLRYLITVICLCVLVGVAHAKKPKLIYEDDEVYMRLIMRSDEQLSAFYQGREFSQEAIREILQTCYVTPIIKNKKFDVLMLDLTHWSFYVDGKPLPRIDRLYWATQWQAISMKQAHRSTFGWTLMPEQRDLRFDEGVGGAVVVQRQSKPMELVARFVTTIGDKKSEKIIRFKGFKCE